MYRDTDQVDWRPAFARIAARLPAYLRLGWALAKEPEIETRDKAALLGGVLYSVSPVDLVPGIIPVFGQLDDLMLLLGGIRTTLRKAPPETAARLLSESGLTMEDLEEDMRTLKTAARATGKAVARAAARGGRAVAVGLARGLAWTVRTGLRLITDNPSPGRK